MRAINALFSSIHFFIVVLILGAGAFFLGLPSAPYLRSLFVRLISEKYTLFYLIGTSTLLIGCSLLVGFYLMHRGRYYRIKMHSHQAVIEADLIRQYVEKYWKALFPKEDPSIEVILSPKQKIEIVIELSEFPSREQKKLLSKLEKELGAIFLNSLGYTQDFLLTIVTK